MTAQETVIEINNMQATITKSILVNYELKLLVLLQIVVLLIYKIADYKY